MVVIMFSYSKFHSHSLWCIGLSVQAAWVCGAVREGVGYVAEAMQRRAHLMHGLGQALDIQVPTFVNYSNIGDVYILSQMSYCMCVWCSESKGPWAVYLAGVTCFTPLAVLSLRTFLQPVPSFH